MTQEALKQALEALLHAYHEDEAHPKTLESITAIKEALAQTEPVAWVDPITLHHLKIGLEGVHLVYETEMVNSLPLYDKPQRTWVGLTNDELTDLFYNKNLGQESAVSQAIALLKEKNGFAEENNT